MIFLELITSKLKIFLSQLDWFKLRFIPNNKIIKSMYIWIVIVPICVKLANHMDSFLELNIFGTIIKLEISLPFNWFIFFFAACLFQLGNIIYLVFCPKIIKDNLTFANFINDKKIKEHLFQYAEEVKIKLPSDIDYQYAAGSMSERFNNSLFQRNW